jgi:hypothetical protein
LKVLKLTALALAVAAIAPGAAMAGTPTAPTLVSSYTSTDTATQSVIGVTQSSGLTITITANGGTTYGVGFTDTLPGGVVLDNPVSATFSGCGTPVDDPSVTGGTLVVTANSNENTITVSGAVVKTTANCVLTFAVLGKTANTVATDADSYGTSVSYATTSGGTPITGGTGTSATLDVLPEPSVDVTLPARKAIYKYKQVVHASYVCAQPDYSTQWDEVGVETLGIQLGGCFGTDDQFNTVNDGQKIDTSVAGSHSLTVSAISFDGDEYDYTVNYKVLPNNVFTLGKIGPLSGDKFPVVAKLPGKGKLEITLWKGKTKVATGTLTVKKGGKATDHLTLTTAGKALTGHPKLKLVANFKPSGGTAFVISKRGVSV